MPGRTGQGSGSGIPSRRPVAHGSSPWCTAKVLSGAQMQRVAVAQASTQPSADSEAPSRLLRFGSSHSDTYARVNRFNLGRRRLGYLPVANRSARPPQPAAQQNHQGRQDKASYHKGVQQ